MRRKKDLSFVNFIVDDQLAGISVVAKAMFGGHGLYLDDIFFGIIYDDRLYFKTNKSTRGSYIDAGMLPFSPSKKQTLKNYYQVPAGVLDDDTQLTAWAIEAAKCKLD